MLKLRQCCRNVIVGDGMAMRSKSQEDGPCGRMQYAYGRVVTRKSAKSMELDDSRAQNNVKINCNWFLDVHLQSMLNGGCHLPAVLKFTHAEDSSCPKRKDRQP